MPDAPNYTPPFPIDGVPEVRPDCVKGIVASDERRPDRHFYLFDEQSETVWEADGWFINPGHDGRHVIWTILLTCPRCSNVLKLDSTRKKFLVDERGIQTDEPIQCSYPAEFGDGAPCGWRVEFACPPKPLFMDVVLMGQSRRIKIDAVVKKV